MSESYFSDPLPTLLRACDALIAEAEANADFAHAPDGRLNGWVTIHWEYVGDLMAALQWYRISPAEFQASDEVQVLKEALSAVKYALSVFVHHDKLRQGRWFAEAMKAAANAPATTQEV